MMRVPKKKRDWKQYWPLYIMILPALAYLVINNYLPIFGLLMAFQKVNFRHGILGGTWVGLDNFRYLFASDAWIITRNTIAYNIVFLVLGPIFGIAIAIMLNDLRSRAASSFYQTVLLVPYLMSMVVISYLSYAFLSADTGFLNNILSSLGLKEISWYSESKYWPFILVIVHVWNTAGFQSIVYLANIVGIDQTYFEAARLDGASKLQTIWYITLPMLKPTIITLTIIGIGAMMRSDFGLFYQVPRDNGALYSVTQTIDTYVYRGLMGSGAQGLAAAAGFYQSIVGFILVIFSNRIIKKVGKEHALF